MKHEVSVMVCVVVVIVHSVMIVLGVCPECEWQVELVRQ